MKVKRNYRFVLTVQDNGMAFATTEVTGQRLFASECHYYTEKSIIEAIKEAEKTNTLDSYYGHTYAVYKETKPVTEIVEREEDDGTKVTETKELPRSAMLIEVITVDENDVAIR